MARRELRKDSPQVEAALQIEREEAQKQLLVDLRGDPEGPAFNHGAQSIDEVVINFAHIKTDDDVKRVIQELADSDIDAIDKARRGVVGWDQTQLEAEKIDAWNMLTERAEGQPLNAAQTVAARTLWTKSGAAARGLAERLHRDPSPINKLAYKNALAVHAAIQRSVLGARAETARALNAWAIPVEAKNLEDVLELVGEEKNLEKIAKQHLKLTEAGMMAQADTLIYGSSFAKGKDMVNDLIYFSYLSGPKTHMRNIIGNAVVAPVHMLEREIAAGIGKLRGAAPGDRVESGEGAAYLYGMIKGTVRALRVSKKAEETGTVWRAWEEGESGFGVGKVEQPRIGGFDPEKHNIAPSTPDGSPLKSPGDLGSMNPYYMLMHGLDGIVRTPGKALAAGDELFKTQNYDAEINALAWREARAAMDRGDIAEDQVYDHAHKLVESPESYMELGAAVRAQRQTFTDVPEDTNFRHLWKAIARKTPWPLNKFILPFDRTAYNIGLYGFERTPLAPITQRFRTAIEKGGVDRDTALAQLAVGNSLLLIGLDLAMSGRITGHGPANMSQREGWMQEHAPMSFEFEQEDGSINSYSVRGIEPIGTFLGIAAGINDIVEGQDWENPDKEADKLLLAASMAIASQVTSQQYMSGVSSFFEMMSDPHRYADGYFKRIAGIASPTILSDITRVDDPVFRHVSSMIDAIKARAPGYSKELPGKFDRWGNQISRRSHMGPVYDAVSPFAARKMKPQPVDRELARLRKSVSKPSPYQTFYRDRVEDYKYGEAISINLKQLYPHAYWRMVEIAGKEVTETSDGDSITVMQGMFESSGKPLVEELNMIVDGSHPHVDEEVYRRVLTDGPEGGKQAFLTAIINAYRKEAKYKVLDEYPEVKAEVESRMKPEKYNWEAF
ncbi:hypothetical protein [uncultured Paraglaciecola sp.]|uniref:hypothetical protein n=1 Tax=uncultured Paraglaciecola sp. TaxID=1765024 RepID=UPI0026098C85|nr:hypothetical protein [uncultured Paraglaciecola sp.]